MSSVYPPDGGPDQQETLLEFPCKFPIKAMGRNDAEFEGVVTEIVLAHAGLYAGEAVTTQPSSSAKFISVTVTIEALSKAQLDRIYQDLTDCEQVLVAL